jgi:uncharacterized protein
MRASGGNTEAGCRMHGRYGEAGRGVLDRRSRLGPIAWAGLAIGIGAVLLLLVLRLLMIGTPLAAPWLRAPPPELVSAAPADDEAGSSDEAGRSDEAGHARFVSFVLDDVQATWQEVFERHDLVYRDANLVLYRGSVDSPCGAAPAAAGPFYCHDDGNVYLDLSSYDRERERNGAAVDLGETYAIAREIGHHVQSLIGTMGETRIAPAVRPTEANGFSVALELQAACFAGVWAASADARGVLAHDDEGAVVAAGPAGGGERWSVDVGRAVPPESAAHATQEERWAWFRTGFDTGDPAACDTFASP